MNLLGIPATLLPANDAVESAVGALGDAPGREAAEALVREFPASSLAWAVLAEVAERDGDTVTAYAFARVGYHRGLDALRKAGWRGQGPVPWSHEPNRGVLRAFAALARLAAAIGETGEPERLRDLIRDADASAPVNTGIEDNTETDA